MNLLKIGKARIVNLDYLVDAKLVAGALTLTFSAPDWHDIGGDLGSVAAPTSYEVRVMNEFESAAIWDHLLKSAATFGGAQ